MVSFAVYAGMFWAALLAATIFPFQSEPVLLTLLLTDSYVWWILVFVATAGNTLGSILNWFIGRNLARLEQYDWFPVKRSSMQKAEAWYQRYGKWSLLLSWAPFIGDPLTLAAGVLREKLNVFIILVLIAKLVRYLVVVAIALRLFQ
ncbi:MAG: YqaA family protein [Minisyncoccota bacterium]